MPRPAYGPTDYENPDAPEGERRLRVDHIDVRDLSYDLGRVRQRFDLYKGAVIQTNIDGLTGDDLPDEVPDGEPPRPRLELFLKERPRGHGYVCDFIYEFEDFPVTVYGTMVNHGRGLMVNELELWRGGPANRWEYRDAWNDYVGPSGTGLRPLTDADTYTGITPTLLRQLPLGQIVAAAQHCLARRDWGTAGVFVDGHRRVDACELPADTRGLWSAAPSRQSLAGEAGPRSPTRSLNLSLLPTWRKLRVAPGLSAGWLNASTVPSRLSATGWPPPAAEGSSRRHTQVGEVPRPVHASPTRRRPGPL